MAPEELVDQPVRINSGNLVNPFDPMLRLESPRLVLRDILRKDVQTLARFLLEPSARPFVLQGQSKRSRVLQSLLLAIDPPPLTHRTAFRLAIQIKESNELIGTCTLAGIEPGSTCAVMGWHIGERHHGRGYATESGEALLRLAFDTNRVRAVNSDCFEHNARAQRVLTKLGMRPRITSRIGKWWLSVRYREDRPIMRYRIDSRDWIGLCRS